MRILLTNDDSFDSPLFHAIYDILKERNYEFMAIMPATEQSWKGKSMTRFGKLSLNKEEVDGRIFFTFGGAPADCVNLGIYNLCDTLPDLVISGINMGYNVSLSYILSSGTIGAAMEGYLAGIASLSLSQQLIPELYQYWYAHRDFPEEAKRHFRLQLNEIFDRLEPAFKDLVKEKGLWSVEFPYKLKENWAIKTTYPSLAHYGQAFRQNEDGTYSHFSPRLGQDSDPFSDLNVMAGGEVALNRLNFKTMCQL